MIIRIRNTGSATFENLNAGEEAWFDGGSGGLRAWNLATNGKINRVYFDSAADNPIGTSTGFDDLNSNATNRDNFLVEIYNTHPSVGGIKVHTNQND